MIKIKYFKAKAIFLAFLFFFALYLFFAKNIFAENESNYNFDFVKSQEINLKEKNLEAKGKIPVVNKFKNIAFEKQINQKINTAIKKRLELLAQEKNIKLININYKIKAAKNFVFVLIYFRLPDKINYLEAINFDIKHCDFLALKDILGQNAIELINKIIKDETIKSPEKYSLSFSGINDSYKNFYVDGDYLEIFFNPYELAPTMKNLELFKIKIDCVKNKVVSEKNYYLIKPYDVKMIGIRYICEAFNFDVSFNQANNFIQVVNNNLSVLAFVNKNLYIKNKSVPKILESQVIIKNNKAYAPISFFKEYLDLFYVIDKDGNIIFSRYMI